MPSSATESERRLASILESSDDAIIGVDTAGAIGSWNGAAEQIFGFTASDAIGQPIRLIVPPELDREEHDLQQRIRTGETVHRYETVRLGKNNRRVQVLLTVSAVRTLEGEMTGAWIVARDITDSKRLERDARHFAAIADSSDDAMISEDLDGAIVSWNRAAERLFGFTAADVVGRSIRLIVPPECDAEEDRVVAAVRRGENVDQFETVRVRKDRSRMPVSLTVSPIRGAPGTVIGASRIARDLSPSQRVHHDALLLAAIVGSSEDAIVSKDLQGVVMSWNAAAEAIFGFSASEMVGQSIRLLIPADRQQEEDEVLSRIRRGERVEHYETIRRRKDGSPIPVSLTVSPIRRDDGTIIGASKIARDITDRRRAEEERQRLLGIARDASRLKDEFLATLSHELRTPLNAIVGYVRLMQAGLLHGEKHIRAIDAVVRNATALTQIVEDVLDVSRIISGRVRLDVEAVELPAIIRDAVEAVQAAADAKDVRIVTVVDPRTAAVCGDPARLRQILWNVCSNAVKFSERGGRVQIRLEQVGSQVNITVSDTGIGITAEFLPHVFERFRQADAGMNRAHGGLGLGLAICRHLVELQGGRIAVESAGLGKGSTFRIELPVPITLIERLAEERPHPPTPLAAPGIVVPQLDGTRILAVDDDSDTLALVREILEATGATVVTADSGREALEKLQRSTADLLLADLGMPRMDGFELIDRVRRSAQIHVRELPAIALTAFARSDDRARALRSGYQLHVAKPIDPGELMVAVGALARRKRSGE